MSTQEELPSIAQRLEHLDAVLRGLFGLLKAKLPDLAPELERAENDYRAAKVDYRAMTPGPRRFAFELSEVASIAAEVMEDAEADLLAGSNLTPEEVVSKWQEDQKKAAQAFGK